jgi:DNA mismatch repair protein MutL
MFRADPQSGDLFDALPGRAAEVLGADFAANAVPVQVEREGLRLGGLAGLPAYSRGSSLAQFLFVNGRPVLDRMLFGALRAAYFDLMPRDRHPAAVLRIDCDPNRVDVNVHPAKSEVRFRDAAAVRDLLVSGVKQALAGSGPRTSSTLGAAATAALRPEARVYKMDRPSPAILRDSLRLQAPEMGFAETPSARIEPEGGEEGRPLGAARAQLHGTYILSQTEEGLVIVDAHAAHERLVYERLKRQSAGQGIAAQALLIPQIVELSAQDAASVGDLAPDLRRLGLTVEPFGGSAVAVRETPAILGPVDAAALIHDILDELADDGGCRLVQARLDAVLSRMACHGSVRSGRTMRAEEMNALLREMEATPNSGTCNHGRPTHVALKLADIERLFGRT